jgi:hypothetical protein
MRVYIKKRRVKELYVYMWATMFWRPSVRPVPSGPLAGLPFQFPARRDRPSQQQQAYMCIPALAVFLSTYNMQDKIFARRL